MYSVLITGGTSGLGKAIALNLFYKGLKVYVVGRKDVELIEMQKLGEGHIIPIQADLSKEESIDVIIDSLKEDILPHNKLIFIIHNAATESPVTPIMSVKKEAFDYAFNLNFRIPFFLTQRLCVDLNFSGRILLISSGLSKRIIPYLSVYSITKSALEMLYVALNAELQKENIFIGCMRPGMMDTKMQERLRNYPTSIFPNATQFLKFQDEKQLFSSEEVTRFITWLLFDISPELFISKVWDYYDENDRAFFKENIESTMKQLDSK